ncbi:MAG: hypothetical protein P9M00_11350 [Candidatus Tritonobacter lacicola]|nr:hypothetical protein [Candidatus Tritonobacter lacicola]
MEKREKVSPHLSLLVLSASVFFFLAGCSSRPVNTAYEPFENILEIHSDFQRHLSDDTYRFPTARDITGKNIYRATLIRLKNYEKAYPRRFEPVVAYSKARAKEKLHDYEGARLSYLECSQMDSRLREAARRNLGIVGRFADIRAYSTEKKDIEDHLAEAEYKIEAWRSMIDELKGTHYECLAREEEERAEENLIWFIGRNRDLIDNGTETLLLMLRQMTIKHAQSKKLNIHYLKFADFYRQLARECVNKNEPAGLYFDRARFNECVNSAMKLYRVVGQKDGVPEKLEAVGRLQAIQAYRDRINDMSD